MRRIDGAWPSSHAVVNSDKIGDGLREFAGSNSSIGNERESQDAETVIGAIRGVERHHNREAPTLSPESLVRVAAVNRSRPRAISDSPSQTALLQ